MSELYSLPDEEELFQMAHAAGFEVPTTSEFVEEFINNLVRYDYDDVVNDLPNWRNECEKSGKDRTSIKRETATNKGMQFAGFHKNDIPVDLARWVSAFAVLVQKFIHTCLFRIKRKSRISKK